MKDTDRRRQVKFGGGGVQSFGTTTEKALS